MRRSIVVVLGFVLLAFALLAGGCGESDGIAAGPSGSVGSDERSAAPAFKGETLQGTEVSLDSYAGKPLVLIFWASW